jgi:hypothetical protein
VVLLSGLADDRAGHAVASAAASAQLDRSLDAILTDFTTDNNKHEARELTAA